ncbi:MAG: hypothetical protein QM296_02855, partial [Bacillota bacterium]|nr:hypothetical protein [Bacillota bacterium]
MDKNCAGAPKPGTNPDFWPRLAKKGRLCPEIGAGTKKLSKGGQKLRWCPKIGHKPRFLATAGQKRPFVPQNRGRNEKIVQGWTKIALVP